MDNVIQLPRRSILHRNFPPGLIRPRDDFKWGEKIARWNASKQKLWAGAGDRSYSFDANMLLSDGAAAYTATGVSQAYGQNGFIDLGGNQNITINLPSIADSSTITPQQARIDAVLWINITAIATGGTNLYKLILQGCNNAAFTSNVQMLGMMEFGGGANIDGSNNQTTPTVPSVGGLVAEILFTNEQFNTKFEFLQLQNVISGNTSPSITYEAFVAVLPEP